jgi:hypothetical protein
MKSTLFWLRLKSQASIMGQFGLILFVHAFKHENMAVSRICIILILI